MTFLEAQLTAYVGKELTANGVTYKVAHADNFQYIDPIDGSVTTKQVKDRDCSVDQRVRQC